MIRELIEEEESFQPYLLNSDYTFIGPINQDLFEPFFLAANKFAPVVSISRSIHHALSDKEAVKKAILTLPSGTPLRIYVVTPSKNDTLLHSSIEEYCRRNNIKYSPN